MCWQKNKASSVVAARWARLMRQVEGPFAAAVVVEKDRFIADVSGAFTRTQQITDVQLERHIAGMRGIYQTYVSVAIRLAVVEALSKGIKQEKDAWESLWMYLVRRWVSEYGGTAARDTAYTTSGDIQRVISAALGFDTEFNPVQVAIDILKVRELSPWRAETIARTETHNAMMFAADVGARKVATDSGIIIKKKWIPVSDERTRVNHSTMASYPAIPMNADFIVGGVPMSRPGDPRGGADNVINCRCVLKYEVQD